MAWWIIIKSVQIGYRSRISRFSFTPGPNAFHVILSCVVCIQFRPAILFISSSHRFWVLPNFLLVSILWSLRFIFLCLVFLWPTNCYFNNAMCFMTSVSILSQSEISNMALSIAVSVLFFMGFLGCTRRIKID